MARFTLLVVWRSGPAEVERLVLYQAATLAFNYLDFGAVRRGLGGTLAHFLPGDAAAAAIWFHFVAAAAVAAAAARLFARLAAPPALRLGFAVVVATIALRWGEDPGRTDMLVAALFGATTLAFASGRAALAAACVGVGLFVHESSFIFGLPLLAALVLQGGGWRRLPANERHGAVAALAAALALYLGMSALPHADLRTVVDAIRARFVPHEYVDWALYFALSGLRGVRASMCQNLTDPSYWVHPAGGLAVIGVCGAALIGRERRRWAWALLAALPGFVFLSIVANDISRWTLFACFNLWLVAAVAPAPPRPVVPLEAPRGNAFGRLAAAALLVPLVLYRPALIDLRIYAGSPLLERLVREAGGPRTPNVAEALVRCDPAWRDVLDPR